MAEQLLAAAQAKVAEAERTAERAAEAERAAASVVPADLAALVQVRESVSVFSGVAVQRPRSLKARS